MVPVPKPKKSSRSVGRPKGAGSTSKAQLKRGRNRTPFNLFYESRLEEVPAITLQQCRQEWEELAVKDKLPFIRKSFESVEDTKLLNKKEQELFAISCGKPAFIGRTAYDYFQRQNRSKYDDLAPKERKQKLDNEYKQMSERQKLDLKVAFLAAKDNYVLAYQNYIKELPEAKQKVEIEYLKSISSGSAGKKDKTLPTKKTKEDDHYPGSTDEDPPVAESTTIKKKQNPTKKKPAAAVPPPVEESEDEEPVTRPPMPSPTKRSRMEPPPRGSPSKVVAEPKAKTKAKKQLEQRFEASSGDDSSASARNGRKRHKEAEAQVEEEEQQQREEEVAEVAESGKKSKKKAKKDEEKPKVPMREPERPPT